MRLKFYILLMVGMMFINSSAFANSAFVPYEPKKHEQVFYQEIYHLNAIDPTAISNIGGSMYPGLRGANQLIIYTPAYGVATGTNEYGAEAVVIGNTVTSLSGADSLIPNDGFVISAHGRAKKWLSENVFVGSKIYIDTTNMQITSYVTSDSFLFGAKEKITEAASIINYYEKNTFNYDGNPAKNYIKRAKRYLNRAEKRPEDVQRYATLAISCANSALATAIPYKSNELKGVWIRPDKNTEYGIIETLDAIQAAGINNIFLETFYHGKTIFPSNTMKSYGFLEQNEIFAGIDPLKIWINEAHKRNIKVHIWFESFYIGNKPPADNPKCIVSVKPSWANTNKRNYESEIPTPSLSEHNGYFLDPANPEVQNFLTSLLREIIINYRPDGINIDYIRYPQSFSAKYPGYENSNWGYTKYARNEFKLLYGEDPINIEYGTNLWDTWDNYRRGKITKFVEKVSNICKKNDVYLSAVVFPNRGTAMETKQQDWALWSENQYVDAFTPLFLTCDAKTIKSMIYEMTKDMAYKTKLYAGLFVTFMGGAEEDLIRQIHETRKLNLDGVIIFDYAHFDEKYIKTLTTSVFANNIKSGKNVVPREIRDFKSK